MSMFDPNLMSASFTSCLTYEGNAGVLQDDLPLTEEPVHVLGKSYSALYDREELLKDIESRIWFTYRRGFTPIGGSGPQTDAGWGCMLRCGQMMLAQALIHRHLSRDWKWTPTTKTKKYYDILRLFADIKSAYYSIHQIVLLDWVIKGRDGHVAIRCLRAEEQCDPGRRIKTVGNTASMGMSEGKQVGEWFGPNTVAQVLKKLSVYDDWSTISIHVALDNTIIMDDVKLMCRSSPSTPDDPVVSHVEVPAKRRYDRHQTRNGLAPGPMSTGDSRSSWRPLVLLIPLRLGLSEINSVYVESLKTCFQMKQSIGIIGGKPNHAHYFIGHIGDELLYLDPHTVQSYVPPDDCLQDDATFHCKHPCRMKVTSLDPSVAVGFFCQTEHDFDDLCQELIKKIVRPNKTPMFEIHQVRPRHWPPFEPYPDTSGTQSEYTYVDERHYDTDEEYELL